jgi:5-methylcytosine-specific restriction enzyme A
MVIARKQLSARARRKLFDAGRGMCCVCGLPIGYKPWIVEHIIPLSMGGADDEANRAPAHLTCARIKTAEEVPVRAKADRQRAAHIGAKAPRRPMPGSRVSGLKKKLDGTVVKR